jgi:hypothetical protein
MLSTVNKEEIMKEFSLYKNKSTEKLITVSKRGPPNLERSMSSQGKRSRDSKLITVKTVNVKKENYINNIDVNKLKIENFRAKSKEKIYYNDIYKSKKYLNLKIIILEFKKDQEYEIENSNESRSFDTKKSRKSVSRKTAPIINPSNVMGNINSRIMRNSKANDIYGKF